MTEDPLLEGDCINIDDLVVDSVRQIVDLFKTLKTLNIVVCGKTGVGKSSLVNAVFREDLATTGVGRPVTDGMNLLTKEDVPLRIYDTRGFELDPDAQKQVKDKILELIEEGIRANDINKAIHCVWYCISTPSHRIETTEIEWLRELSRDCASTQVPVIVVLTQSFSKKDARVMREKLEAENLSICQIVPLLAEDYEVDEDYTVKSYGLEELIQIMHEVLPKELRTTLQNMQKVSLSEKIKHSRVIIATTVTTAFSIGASPIPFSDCTAIIPVQMAMLSAITVVFGVEVTKGFLTALVSSALGTGSATYIGRTVVCELLKLIPGVGSILGGAISGGIAATLTTALGEAYIKIMTMVWKGEMTLDDFLNDKGKKTITTVFNEELTKPRQCDG